MKRLLVAILSLVAVAVTGTSSVVGAEEGGPEDFDQATGYRIARYRSPVPATVPGGTRVGVEEIDRLSADRHAVLLDVMPSDGAGLMSESGEWATKRHDTIPNSTWLPDVGRGRIDARLETYLSDNLARLTGGDRTHAIVVFCQSDCWMGWNAVQRIARLGYTAVYWYPDGVDGWRDWDRALTPATPRPVGHP